MDCIIGDSEILMSNKVEQISNIKRNDKIITLNNDLNMIITPVLKVPCFQTEKLLTITTFTGKHITCTPEHKLISFYSKNKKKMFIPANELQTEKHLLISKHMQKFIPPEMRPYALLNLIDEEYIKKLSETRHLPQFSNNEVITCTQNEIVTCTRIVGFLNSSYKSGFKIIGSEYACILSCLSQEDTQLLYDDIKSMSFDRIQHNDDSIVIYGGDSQFLRILCCKKTCESINIIPDWIIQSDNYLKREFLNGYLSNLIMINNENIIIIEKQCSYSEFVHTHKNMLFVGQMLTDLKINNNITVDEHKLIVSIMLDSSDENIINFINTFDFRYNKKLQNKLFEISQYMKFVVFMTNMIEQQQLNIMLLHKQNTRLSKISTITKIDKKYLKRIIEFLESDIVATTKKLHCIVFKGIIRNITTFDKFIKKYKITTKNNEILFLEQIFSIDEHKNEHVNVFDINVISQTHNYIANGIVMYSL